MAWPCPVDHWITDTFFHLTLKYSSFNKSCHDWSRSSAEWEETGYSLLAAVFDPRTCTSQAASVLFYSNLECLWLMLPILYIGTGSYIYITYGRKGLFHFLSILFVSNLLILLRVFKEGDITFWIPHNSISADVWM